MPHQPRAGKAAKAIAAARATVAARAIAAARVTAAAGADGIRPRVARSRCPRHEAAAQGTTMGKESAGPSRIGGVTTRAARPFTDLRSPTDPAELKRRARGSLGGLPLTSVQVLPKPLPMATVRQRGRCSVAAEAAADAADQRRIRRLRPSDGTHARGDGLRHRFWLSCAHPAVVLRCLTGVAYSCLTVSMSSSVSVMSVEMVQIASAGPLGGSVGLAKWSWIRSLRVSY